MMRDVVIAGAGNAGCLLARELARTGIQVTVLEQKSREQLGNDWSDAVERKPLQDAGLVLPQSSRDRWVGPGVKEEAAGGLFEPHVISSLRVLAPRGTVLGNVSYPVILTDRRVLALTLAQQAEDAGAQILWRHGAESLVLEEDVHGQPGSVQVRGVRFLDSLGVPGEISAHLAVDASGFPGVLRRSLPAYTGMNAPFLPRDCARLYRQVRQRDWQLAFTDSIPDHFQYGLHSGYRWSHQHHSTGVDMGAGIRMDLDEPDPRQLVEEMAHHHPSLEPAVLREGEGCCVLGPPLNSLVTGGFLVLGEAAGMAIPTTGSGVGTALQAALLAGTVIRRAHRKGEMCMRDLWEFNRRFYRMSRGAHLSALAGLHRFLQVLSHREWEFLFDRGVLGVGHLEAILNGRFPAVNPARNLPLLWRGRGNPSLLWRTTRAIQLARGILLHCQRYPLEWESGEFREWQRKARLLHYSICQLARLHQS